MRKPFSIIAVILIICGFGCPSARKSEPLAPPIDTSSPAIAEGQKVFMEHCHQCHPHGEAGLGPSLNNKPLPAFLMKTQVRKGFGAMPSFSQEQISEEKLNDLMLFLKALRQNEAFRDGVRKTGDEESE